MTIKQRLRKWYGILGPGFVTGASDDDPSGIATYTQTGALFGYGQAWTALFSFPFMTAVQEMCGRIGLVTGKGLIGVMKKEFPKPILLMTVFLLFLANAINIGANLGAMASAVTLLIPLPFTVLLLAMMVVSLLLETFVSYEVYAKYLKFLALSLLSYILVAFMIRINWLEVLGHTLVPSFSFSAGYLMNLVAVLGTTISPYLFFWQADQEVEESVLKKKLMRFGFGVPKINRGDVGRMRIDTMVGMFFSNLVMFFIIVVAAATLNANGIMDVQTADQAALALKPLAGGFTFLLFTLGIVGTGLLAVPILAGSASYALAEVFGWKAGLYRKFNQAHGFYGAITLATLLGLVVNYIGVPPFKMLYYTAVVNGMIAPVLLVMILIIGNNERVMGKFRNTMLQNVLTGLITVVMGSAGIALMMQLL